MERICISVRDIICEATIFYGYTAQHPNTLRVLFRMKDAVNGHLLQLAAEQTIRRYPYYAVHCVSDGKEYLLEPHSKPFVVHHTQEPVALGGEESNGYLLAVSYWEDKIWVNLYHGLTDGTGALNFGRTLLYYYCREMYDPDLPADGVHVNDGPIPPEEWENPYHQIMTGERKLPDEKDILVQVKPDSSIQPLNLLGESRVTQTAPQYYDLRIPEQQLMEYCRTQDGTPGVVVSLLMSRAIDRLHPGNNRPIVTGMAMNLRPALGAPLYKGSPLAIAYLPYTDRVRQKPFDTQATIYRGRLILAADQERLLAGVKASTRLYNAIDQQPTVEKKCQLAKQVVDRYHGGATFNVSYVGPARLAAMEPYVLETLMQNDCTDLTIEMMASHGSFFLTIVQEWKEDMYFKAFCEELKAQGIEYELLSQGEHHVPLLTLPDKSL